MTLLFYSLGVCLLSFLVSEWWGIISFLLLSTCYWISRSRFDLGTITFTLVDEVSYLLILLTVWVRFLIIRGRFYVKIQENKKDLFLFLILRINLLLVLSFSVSNLLIFYILFEATLIPIFIIIFGWGYQPERVTASYYLLFYTLFASLPLLVAILYLERAYMTLDYQLLASLVQSKSGLLFLAIVLAFLVKLPVYFGHLWLPKAHVEAPMAGSMVLAGVLLKLGGYGLLRTVPLFLGVSSQVSRWLICVGLFGAACASLICIRQTDLKSLIAYSSVAHIGLVIVGVFLLNWTRWMGCIIILIAHGLCSSGLFYLVGILYYRLGSRRLLLVRGCLSSIPLITLWWFLLVAANIAAPPTPNLAGEILIFMARIRRRVIVVLVVGFSSFMGAAYNLFLFSSTQHGTWAVGINSCSETSLREHFTLFFHMLPLLISLFLLVEYY